jgi:formyltetrahydrofolate synthetase
MGSELGLNVMACIRQPSMGPTFNIRAGRPGSQQSMEDFNLPDGASSVALMVAAPSTPHVP